MTSSPRQSKVGTTGRTPAVASVRDLRPTNNGKIIEKEGPILLSLAIMRRVYGNEHPHVATCLGRVGGVLQDLGRFDEALMRSRRR